MATQIEAAVSKVEGLRHDLTMLALDKNDLEKQLEAARGALAENSKVMHAQARELAIRRAAPVYDERALLVFLSGRIENQAVRSESYLGDFHPIRDYLFEEFDNQRIRVPASYADRPSYSNTIRRRRFRYLRQVGKLHIYEEV